MAVATSQHARSVPSSVSLRLDSGYFVQPGLKYGRAARFEGNEVHAHSHAGMRMRNHTPSREDVPLIGNLDVDDSALRQRIGRIQITAIGTQVACSGLKPGARC